MQVILNSLLLAFGVLFTVAVFVAVWEHWRDRDQNLHPAEPARARAVSVDLDVDALSAATPMPSDREQRHAALDAALEGMVRGSGEAVSASASPWTATEPMTVTAAEERQLPAKAH